MLPEIDGANALPFAEKIRQLVEKTEFKFEDTRIPVTISMGVATIDAELDRRRRRSSSAPTSASTKPRPAAATASARSSADVGARLRGCRSGAVRRGPATVLEQSPLARASLGQSAAARSSARARRLRRRLVHAAASRTRWASRAAASGALRPARRRGTAGAVGRRRLDLAQRREQRRRQVGDDVDGLVLEAGLLELELDRRVAVRDLDRQRRQAQRLAVAARTIAPSGSELKLTRTALGCSATGAVGQRLPGAAAARDRTATTAAPAQRQRRPRSEHRHAALLLGDEVVDELAAPLAEGRRRCRPAAGRTSSPEPKPIFDRASISERAIGAAARATPDRSSGMPMTRRELA